jgi:hypothetical protein
MGTEQSKGLKLSGLIGSNEFNEFIFMLDNLFIGQDYMDPKGEYYKKAAYSFELFKKSKWTIEEFRYVMNRFQFTWAYQNWMPVNFFEIHKRNYGSTEMVM